MSEYILTQIELLGNLRRAIRVAGIIAGVAAAAIPIGSVFMAFSGFSGPASQNVLELSIATLVIALPIGFNFMFLEIALRARIVDLNSLQASTGNEENFRSRLSPYLAKIKVHRIILWVFGGLVTLQCLGQGQDPGFQEQEGFSLLYPVFSYPAQMAAAILGLLVAGVHIYLGFVLSNHVKAMKTPVQQ